MGVGDHREEPVSLDVRLFSNGCPEEDVKIAAPILGLTHHTGMPRRDRKERAVPVECGYKEPP